MSDDYQRLSFRVEYPPLARPGLVTDSGSVPVMDCSETGLRFLALPGQLPERGAIIIGKVQFHNGGEVAVEGLVTRVQDGTVALRLEEPGIPFGVILSEQQYLRRRFPMKGQMSS